MSLERIEHNQKKEESEDCVQIKKSELEIILKQIEGIRNELKDLKK